MLIANPLYDVVFKFLKEPFVESLFHSGLIVIIPALKGRVGAMSWKNY
jgi:hypothetical protein